MPNTKKLPQNFKLTRAYSFVSLVGIIIVAFTMSYFYRIVAIDALMTVQDESNADLARSFSQLIWAKNEKYFTLASTMSSNQLVLQLEIPDLMEDIKHQTHGMRVVKIKVYDHKGMTVFSSDIKQIGQDGQGNPGFIGAMQGQVISEIVFKNKFNSFDNVIEKRNLISSYLPIRHGSETSIVGVFELYTDITTLLNQVRETEYKIMILVSGLMLALYAFLLIYIRRADKIIRQHEKYKQQRQQEKIKHMAEHDQLTGLPNRVLLTKLLNKAVKKAEENNHTLAVFYMDIDRFKLINDNLGQENGNQILLQLVKRIKSMVTEHEIVSRIAGDEFVLVQEYSKSSTISINASRIINESTKPININENEVALALSVGITLFPEDKNNAENLLKDAEAAMLRAKQLGRNRYAFYAEEFNIRAIERFELERNLHKASKNNEFELFYQSRIDAKSGKILGAEALIRWIREDGSIISPALFVPVLEEIDLIDKVGAWVIQTACRECKAWHNLGYEDLRISVNLSMKQFHSGNLFLDIRNALLDSGLDAIYLELELTESLLSDDTKNTIKLLNELKALGVHLSIDDFGTGYSSLTYLMNFPIDCLKIDQAFVKGAINNPEHANLTRTIIAMAKNLNLKTVAEGVEMEAHKEFLMKLSCDELQGYFFSKPIASPKFRLYLQQQNDNLTA